MLSRLVKPITHNVEDAPPPAQKQTLRRLFGYLRPYRGRMVLTLSLYAVCVTITQLYPFVDRTLIDNHIAVNNPDGFLPLLALAAVAHALVWVGVLIRSLLIQRVSWSILVDLRRQLFEHVVGLSFKFHEKEPVGKTMTRFINDANTLKVRNFIASKENGTEQQKAGGFSPHTTADVSLLPNKTLQTIASEVLYKATAARFDGSDLMPAKVGAGTFWTEPVKWLSGQQDLDTTLKNIDDSFPKAKS